LSTAVSIGEMVQRVETRKQECILGKKRVGKPTGVFIAEHVLGLRREVPGSAVMKPIQKEVRGGNDSGGYFALNSATTRKLG